MKLSNKWASNLLNKDKQLSTNAAQHIINNSDIEAWFCLLENSDYIFDFIKEKAGKSLQSAINKNNYNNIYPFLKKHSPDWDEYLVLGLIQLELDCITESMLNLLATGDENEKAYAAKYFTFVREENAKKYLFSASMCEYQPLKVNSAKALGILEDNESYNFYLERLDEGDDWEKIDAAQFLSTYGDKKAFIYILKAMNKSGMSEYLAGEAAMLDDIKKYFNYENEELKTLSLECFDNILSGLAEVWSLSALLDFKVYETLETLIDLANSDIKNNFSSKYSQLLLKAKSKISMFIENEEYRFDEDKNVIAELDNIHNLLNSQTDYFWNEQLDDFENELDAENDNRKLSAINLISDMNLDFIADKLIDMVQNYDLSDIITTEIILSLNKLGYAKNIQNKDNIISKIKDENLIAIAKTTLLLN